MRKEFYFLLFLYSFVVKAQTCGSFNKIVTGVSHSVGIKKNGTLWTWGNNLYGQLGDGTTAQKVTPVQVGNATNWSSIAAGDNHTLAIKADGTLWAWGQNSVGQLGDGTTTQRNFPVQIGTDTNWATISAGLGHTLAIKTDGTLWVWGYNAFGQLGNGTTSQRNVPTQIGIGYNWIKVSAGSMYTLAIQSDGTLWAWGDNGFGQLGDGSTSRQYQPVQIGTETSWVNITSKNSHSLGIKQDGTLWAWGDNGFGQLGNGSNSQSNIPLQIGVDTNWKSVSAGRYHTEAIKFDNTLWAWGYNLSSQLGDGTTTQTPTPIQVGVGISWLSVSAGDSYTHALNSDGYLWAWGANGNGRLGDGSITPRNLPTQISYAYPQAPMVTNVSYVIGDVATPLTAIPLGANILYWYTSATDNSGSMSAPVPSTSAIGTNSYWVSQKTSIGACESPRAEIVVTVSGLPNSATHLNFDGIDDYVSAPFSVNPVNSDLTCEAYVNPTDISGNQIILKNGGKLTLSLSNGYLTAEIWHDGTSTNLKFFKSNTAITVNSWSHVAITWNNTSDTLLMYINGNLVTTTNSTVNLENEFTIGGDNSITNGKFKGNIDEVRIFNKVLSQTNIQETMNCELQSGQTGLLAYYKFNQGAENANNIVVTSVTDSSTNGNNGTLNNFALTGLTSNWKSGSPIITGTSCATLAVVNYNNEINARIYPNPSENIINIDLKNLNNARLEIFDINGRLIQNQVLSQPENKADISSFNSGIYLFKVSSSEGISTVKVVKQ